MKEVYNMYFKLSPYCFYDEQDTIMSRDYNVDGNETWRAWSAIRMIRSAHTNG